MADKLPKMSEWFMRAHFPGKSGAALGFPSELWVRNPAQYPGWQELDTKLRHGNNRPSKSTLVYYFTRQLLGDVLIAAGGVERAVLRLRSDVAELQQWVTEQGFQASAGVLTSLSHPAATDAQYALTDVITWSRTVVERLDRRSWGNPNQGLIPAIKAKRLKKRLNYLNTDLCSGPVGDTRYLANFTLHAALVRDPSSGVRLNPDGTVALPFPDQPSGSVLHWSLLTWTDNRDGIIVAEELWQAIQTFVDDLLAAFEKAVPKRLRK